jgi:hypothetical protein
MIEMRVGNDNSVNILWREVEVIAILCLVTAVTLGHTAFKQYPATVGFQQIA